MLPGHFARHRPQFCRGLWCYILIHGNGKIETMWDVWNLWINQLMAQPIWPLSTQDELIWLFWLTGKSKTSPKILIFSAFLANWGEKHWDWSPHIFVTHFLIDRWSALIEWSLILTWNNALRETKVKSKTKSRRGLWSNEDQRQKMKKEVDGASSSTIRWNPFWMKFLTVCQ